MSEVYEVLYFAEDGNTCLGSCFVRTLGGPDARLAAERLAEKLRSGCRLAPIFIPEYQAEALKESWFQCFLDKTARKDPAISMLRARQERLCELLKRATSFLSEHKESAALRREIELALIGR